jgi:hypothetical protein
MSSVGLDRRFANFRQTASTRPISGTADRSLRSTAGAERLAATLDGELVRTPQGAFVRVESPSTLLPLDRRRLARLPGQPPAEAPLLCLDTETTGLATAAGTLAFLVGLGWWDGSVFRQIQLLLPDHADEPALLAELARHIRSDAWLVTYNGRGFDWPLLVARYRMARADPPLHSGHLDLLPLVRRVFRHRMPDARLASVESVLLGIGRHGDVGGWEIPGRYLEFLRNGEPLPLLDVVHHNSEDVRSLARLLVHIDRGYADEEQRRDAPGGDLGGLARAFAAAGRDDEALACVEQALEGGSSRGMQSSYVEPRIGDGHSVREARGAVGSVPSGAARPGPSSRPIDPDDDGAWWSPRRRPDFGGRPGRYAVPDGWRAPDPVRRDAEWTETRLLAERARLLRRLRRDRDAEAAWVAVASTGGTLGVLAWIEVAKLREHRFGDLREALAAASLARRIAERQRWLGRPLPRLEVALTHRVARLDARIRRNVEGSPRSGSVGGQPDRRGGVVALVPRSGPTERSRSAMAAASGTPSNPGPSTTREAAAAATRSAASARESAKFRPDERSSNPASIAARNTSPAPVASTSRPDDTAG